MKLLLLCILAIFSVSAFSSESCYQSCNSDANQVGLMCQKMRQNCLKLATRDPMQFEMCMDDVGACLQNGSKIYDSCNEACKEEGK